MRRSRLKTLILMALFGSAVAFAYTACFHKVRSSFLGQPPGDAELKCIAILPFNNATDYPEARAIFEELMAVELYRSRRFMVLESSEVGRILEWQGMALDGSIDLESARRIGGLLGVDGVVFGSVSEYGFKNLSTKARAIPVAGIQAVLLDVKKGGVFWSGEAWENGFDLSLSHRMPLNEVAQLVTKRLLRPLILVFPERELDHRRACWGEAGVITIAKKVDVPPVLRPVKNLSNQQLDKPPMQRPIVSLSNQQKEFFDLIIKSKSGVLEGVTFKPGGVALSPVSIASLQNVGPALKAILDSNPAIILRLEGHCDAMESEERNQEISLKRAERAKEFFISNFSLPPDRIEAVGAGSARPIMPNTTARGREKNRRVEVHAIISQQPGVQ